MAKKKTTTFYMDKEGNETTKAKATQVVIAVYEGDRLVEETWGQIPTRGKKQEPDEEDVQHVPLFVDATCPLCLEQGADYYAGHKGLLVCRSCGRTFDPSVES